jgi:hypothetical protein
MVNYKKKRTIQILDLYIVSSDPHILEHLCFSISIMHYCAVAAVNNRWPIAIGGGGSQRPINGWWIGGGGQVNCDCGGPAAAGSGGGG